MKLIKQLREFVVSGWTPMLIGFPLALSAFAASEKVWIAKPTGVRSCDAGVVRPDLGGAISDLEDKSISVRTALIGRIAGQAQCMGCDCPDGTYNVAEVDPSPTLNSLIESTDWELVRAKDVKVDE